jgi:FHS family L-fucose permease-like MFS transporter
MLVLVVFLFFAWGFATVLIDTLIPKLKGLFDLNYAEAMLTQFSFFLSYFLFSMPAAVVLAHVGYTRSIVLGLAVMAGGCALFAPAALAGVYPAFLLALFVMAAGITMLQVAANPYVAILGPEQTSSSRLTLAQAFNSLGTTIGPLVGAALILDRGAPIGTDAAVAMSEAARRAEASALQVPFLAIAAALVVVAAVFWWKRKTDTTVADAAADLGSSFRVLRKLRLALGAVSIFVYVGAEVSIGSLMVNYLIQSSVLGVTAAQAGRLISFYWGGAMIGRFVGSYVLQKLPAGLVLTAVAVGAAALAGTSAVSTGTVAAATLIAVGLCNSIMFPTIFTLALEGLGGEKPAGSGALCMAIVGGAIVPVITGAAADRVGLAASLLVPAVCYLWIVGYGIYTWRSPVGETPTA